MIKRTYVIAEIGVNHNGDVDTARRLVDAAQAAGADAAKFQFFSPQLLVTPDAATAGYQRQNDGAATQSTMLQRLAFDAGQLAQVRDHCRKTGIEFLCTPFDLPAVDTLERLDVSALKIGSGDLTYDRLLARASETGLPLILSTGMSEIDDIAHAVNCISEHRPAGAEQSKRFPPLTVMHCTSSYPAPDDEINLRAMQTIAGAFDVPVGYSDHSHGTEVAVLAVAMGATMLEKHLTLDRGAPGPDHKASLEPDAFTEMVRRIRLADAIAGVGEKRVVPSERDVRLVARRSLHYARAVEAGQVLQEADIIALRPGDGIPPTSESRWIGRRLVVSVHPRMQLKPEHFG